MYTAHTTIVGHCIGNLDAPTSFCKHDVYAREIKRNTFAQNI